MTGKEVFLKFCELLFAWFDDKTQVIGALTLIALVAVWQHSAIQNPVAVLLGNIVSGLLGVAIGRALPKPKDQD